MKHMKCLFLTIFLDCSWLWKQGLKSFLLALQVRLLNGMFTYCWELFDSLCWYPVFLITEFLLDKLRHLGWDGWVSSRSSMVVTHAVLGCLSPTPSSGLSSLTLSLAWPAPLCGWSWWHRMLAPRPHDIWPRLFLHHILHVYGPPVICVTA